MSESFCARLLLQHALQVVASLSSEHWLPTKSAARGGACKTCWRSLLVLLAPR